jgi:hypothetical protein
MKLTHMTKQIPVVILVMEAKMPGSYWNRMGLEVEPTNSVKYFFSCKMMKSKEGTHAAENVRISRKKKICQEVQTTNFVIVVNGLVSLAVQKLKKKNPQALPCCLESAAGIV